MNGLDKKKYWIWFSLIKGLGCVRKNRLLQLYSTPEKIYKLTKQDLLKINGIGEETVLNILQSKNDNILDYHIKYMEKNNIDIVNIYENDYPQLLRKIYDAPISLYIKGNKKSLNRQNIGIVGCRECSDYGKKAAKYFAYNLSKESVNVVSGLAKGVDSYAHWGAVSANIEFVKCGQQNKGCGKQNLYGEKTIESCGKQNVSCGKTIAVLGNGLDTIYPKENVELANEIIKNDGAIISEYPCGTKPDKMNFPARNRIISGMSKGIIVVEAKEKSRNFNYG